MPPVPADDALRSQPLDEAQSLCFSDKSSEDLQVCRKRMALECGCDLAGRGGVRMRVECIRVCVGWYAPACFTRL